MKTNNLSALLLALLVLHSPFSTFAQGTAFTYQGRLTDSGSPANGLYDFIFSVFDAARAAAAVWAAPSTPTASA